MKSEKNDSKQKHFIQTLRNVISQNNPVEEIKHIGGVIAKFSKNEWSNIAKNIVQKDLSLLRQTTTNHINGKESASSFSRRPQEIKNQILRDIKLLKTSEDKLNYVLKLSSDASLFSFAFAKSSSLNIAKRSSLPFFLYGVGSIFLYRILDEVEEDLLKEINISTSNEKKKEIEKTLQTVYKFKSFLTTIGLGVGAGLTLRFLSNVRGPFRPLLKSPLEPPLRRSIDQLTYVVLMEIFAARLK